jgi:hypothetical protein
MLRHRVSKLERPSVGRTLLVWGWGKSEADIAAEIAALNLSDADTVVVVTWQSAP